MKRCIMIILVIIQMITICGCTTDKLNHDIYSKIYKRYADISSYTATVNVTVYSGTKSETYKYKQYYTAPDKFRADVLLPENLLGTGYLFNKDGLYIYSNGSGEMLDGYIPNDKDYMFIPDFFENYYKSMDAAAEVVKDLTGEQTQLTAVCNSDNRYRFEQCLWIDNKTCLPSRLETYDINHNTVMCVEFEEFELNPKIGEDVFKR